MSVRSEYFFNGILFPPFMDPEWITKILDYPVSPGDLYIVTYPKSGTMWTLQIVSLIQNGGGQKDKHNTEAIPWLEQIDKKAAYVNVLCS